MSDRKRHLESCVTIDGKIYCAEDCPLAPTQPEPGCGWTTQQLVDQLIASASQQYEDALKKVHMTPTRRADVLSTYITGMRHAILHLEGMGVLTVFPGDGTK